MLIGQADNRMLVNIGVSFNRRLLLNHAVNWQYSAEFLPVALESDPVVMTTVNWTSPTVLTEHDTATQVGPCVPASGNFSTSQNSTTYSYSYVLTCARQWTMGEAMSPIGMQWNFLPHRRAQPFLAAHGGYMFSARPIPVANAGSFNFTFDVGAGVELYRSKARSIRAEFRYHHISNADTATLNPGIDSGLFQVTYCFRLGRQ